MDGRQKYSYSMPEGFRPFFEWQNICDDNSGAMDHIEIIQDDGLVVVTNFLLIQSGLRNAIPSKKLHMGPAWTDFAVETNTKLSTMLEDNAINPMERFARNITGIYIKLADGPRE